MVNGQSEKTGSLLEDFEPAFNPPKEIDDVNDKKPEDWVDEEKIADPEAKKVYNSLLLSFSGVLIPVF